MNTKQLFQIIVSNSVIKCAFPCDVTIVSMVVSVMHSSYCFSPALHLCLLVIRFLRKIFMKHPLRLNSGNAALHLSDVEWQKSRQQLHIK